MKDAWKKDTQFQEYPLDEGRQMSEMIDPLRALVAQWQAMVQRPDAVFGGCTSREEIDIVKNVYKSCADDLDALLSAPVVSECEEISEREKAAIDLLKRLYGWDTMDLPNSDGAYWRGEIMKVVAPIVPPTAEDIAWAQAGLTGSAPVGSGHVVGLCQCMVMAGGIPDIKPDCPVHGGSAPVGSPPQEKSMNMPVWKCLTCGCLWRDNLDETVSLLNSEQKSCASCEHTPTQKACAIHWLQVKVASAPRGGGETPQSCPKCQGNGCHHCEGD